MKNTILYYYNLNPESIHNVNDYYYFRINSVLYELFNCDNYIDRISDIYDISYKLLKHGFPVHEIILNKDNFIVTIINEKNYVLMKVNIEDTNLITLNDILVFNKNVLLFKELFASKIKWNDLWETKVDYYEYQINQLGKKYPLLRNSFSYYDGLTECANILFKEIKDKVDFNVISHKRIKINHTIKDLYNPFNLIIDTSVRSVCEYFKGRYLNNLDVLEEIKLYLKNSNYNNEEYILFFVRMMFPSFYYDEFQNIVFSNKDERLLNYIISNVDNYENLLFNLYEYIRNFCTIPEIEWLIKKI